MTPATWTPEEGVTSYGRTVLRLTVEPGGVECLKLSGPHFDHAGEDGPGVWAGG